MPRFALVVPALMSLLLAACAGPAAPVPRNSADARLDACRAEAERIVQRRERGQTMRADETEGGRGFVTVAPYSRAVNDAGFARLERDRIIAECMGGSPRAGGS